VVISLKRGADLHMAQLVPLPLTVSCFSKIQTGFTFLVLAYPSSHANKGSLNGCMCVCLFPCLCSSVRDHTFETTRPIITRFFVHVTYGRASVLLWRRSDMLRTSGFLDDAIFAHTPRLHDVAAQLRRSSHAALGLAVNSA